MAATRPEARVRFAFVVIALAFGSSRSHAVEIVGHRGASHDAPENTLASFRLAWAQNADAAELDVYLSKDGEVVVIHDKTTNRLGHRDRRVADQTLAELKQLDVGRWKGEKWAGERIPTLAEVLPTIPDGKRLFIEIKCGPEVIPRLVDVLRESHKRPEQTCLIGFSYDVMKQAKHELPATKCYWIVELKQDKQTGRWLPNLDELITKTKQAGLDGLDFGDGRVVWPALDRDFVTKIKKAGLAVHVWTVDSAKQASQLEQAGVDGITTNRPGFMKERLQARR